jgi:hypothetical protein
MMAGYALSDQQMHPEGCQPTNPRFYGTGRMSTLSFPFEALGARRSWHATVSHAKCNRHLIHLYDIFSPFLGSSSAALEAPYQLHMVLYDRG